MRELKFRIWSKQANRMYTDQEECYFIMQNLVKDIDNRKHYEISQYTGMDDSEYINIYEGDILCHPDDPDIRASIEWGYGGYVSEQWCMVPYWSEWKIVGNIFENPDMIK